MSMRTSAVPAGEYVPTADQRIVFHGVPWADFETLLRIKGDAPSPRIAYLGGELEVMSPSKDHERIKSLIGSLIEAYADVAGLVIGRYGSWTLKNALRETGAEPDECFIVGADQDKDAPDLVIEVAWTSGGLGKLEIYRRLGIREVWRWKDDHLEVHVLRKGRYELATRSRMLPRLPLALLTSFIGWPVNRQPVRAFRQALVRSHFTAPPRRPKH